MLIDRIPGHRVKGHNPAPRVVVSSETWRMLATELAAGRVTLFPAAPRGAASGSLERGHECTASGGPGNAR